MWEEYATDDNACQGLQRPMFPYGMPLPGGEGISLRIRIDRIVTRILFLTGVYDGRRPLHAGAGSKKKKDPYHCRCAHYLDHLATSSFRVIVRLLRPISQGEKDPNSGPRQQGVFEKGSRWTTHHHSASDTCSVQDSLAAFPDKAKVEQK